MTRATNSRIAGFTFLFYIAAGLTDMFLFNSATRAEGTAAKLALIAQHATTVRVTVLLGLLECFCALVLAVTLYAITRDVDPDLALLAMICRVAEGVGGASLATPLGLLWLATSGPGVNTLDPSAVNTLGTFLLKGSGFGSAAAFFAVGSTIFCCLFLRGRIIPVALAWLGVFASVLVVVLFPAQLAGFLKGPLTEFMWIPMLVFEVAIAFWLMIKGAAPARALNVPRPA